MQKSKMTLPAIDDDEFEQTPSGAPDSALRSGETVERIALELKNRILEGRLVPGQRLISRDMVDELNVSRGSMREAFRRLEADRLVDVIPNRGAVVKKLAPHEIRHLFQIREALEGQASRLAAHNIGAGDNRKRFKEVFEQCRRHRRHPVLQEFVVDNRAFHQEIVRLSGNSLLGELVDRYQLPVFTIQLRQQIGSDQMIQNALVEHDAIAEAILAGDGEGAYNAMSAHLGHSATLILSLPSLARPLDRTEND